MKSLLRTCSFGSADASKEDPRSGAMLNTSKEFKTNLELLSVSSALRDNEQFKMIAPRVKSLFGISATRKKKKTASSVRTWVALSLRANVQPRNIVGVNVCSEDKPINYLIKAGAVISSSFTPETWVKDRPCLCVSTFWKLIVLIANESLCTHLRQWFFNWVEGGLLPNNYGAFH